MSRGPLFELFGAERSNSASPRVADLWMSPVFTLVPVKVPQNVWKALLRSLLFELFRLKGQIPHHRGSQYLWMSPGVHFGSGEGSATMIENYGDTLEEAHMPLGWPISIDGAVRQFCMHKKDTIQELNSMLAEFNLQRSSVEINCNTNLWAHNAVWNKKFMDPAPGQNLQRLWDASEHYICRKASRSRDVPEEAIRQMVREIQQLQPANPPDNLFMQCLGRPQRDQAPPQNVELTRRALEEWERTICENKAMAILEQIQEGRPALFQRDGGAMLIAIVLDRPLQEAQELVDQPHLFLQEIQRCPWMAPRLPTTLLINIYEHLRHLIVFFFRPAPLWLSPRSSHLVVLMNELRKCIHCIPLWGFKSGAKSLQSGASSKTKNQQRHNKKQTPTTHTPNNTKQKQNAKGNMAWRLQKAMASSASELADLAQKHQDNKQKDNSARSREGVQQNTSTSNAETQDPPCQDPGDRTEEPSGIRHLRNRGIRAANYKLLRPHR